MREQNIMTLIACCDAIEQERRERATGGTEGNGVPPA